MPRSKATKPKEAPKRTIKTQTPLEIATPYEVADLALRISGSVTPDGAAPDCDAAVALLEAARLALRLAAKRRNDCRPATFASEPWKNFKGADSIRPPLKYPISRSAALALVIGNNNLPRRKALINRIAFEKGTAFTDEGMTEFLKKELESDEAFWTFASELSPFVGRLNKKRSGAEKKIIKKKARRAKIA